MKTRPLKPGEQARIDDALAAFCQMAEDAGLIEDGGEAGEEQSVTDLADELLIRWAAEPPTGRLAPEVMATIIGAALGDFLVATLRVMWGTGSDGAIGLMEEVSGVPLYSPFDLVRERLGQAEEGFAGDLVEDLLEQSAGLIRPE